MDEVEYLDEMIKMIGDSISERDAFAIVQNIFNKKLISKREGNIILAILDKGSLQVFGNDEDAVRAHLLTKQLQSIRYKA